MPQLDLTWFPSQIFWLVVTFFTMYLVFSRIALPRIGAVLDERQRRVDEDLERAEALKVETEALTESYEASLSEAKRDVQKMFADAKDDIARLGAEKEQALAKTLSDKIRKAEEDIAAAKDDMLTQVEKIARETTRRAGQSLTGVRFPAQDINQIVGDVLKEGDV